MCQNGASAVADGTCIAYYPMEEQAAREVADEIRQRPGCEVFVSDFACSYTEQGHTSFTRLVKDVIKIDTVETDDILAVTKGCAKISLYEEAGISDIESWQRRWGSRLTVVTGGPQWLDFMPKGVNKQKALRRLLELRGIQPEEVMVFGDNLNDTEMLEYAGVGAAVATAVPEILACADTVVPRVEDALRDVLAGRNHTEDWKR